MSPPEHSRTKPGQVLNVHGRNGKPAEIDGFTHAMAQPARITIDGAQTTMPTEHAIYQMHAHLALKGSERAFAALSREKAARLKRMPDGPPPTTDEIAAKIEEDRQREALSKRIVDGLDPLAKAKKARIDIDVMKENIS